MDEYATSSEKGKQTCIEEKKHPKYDKELNIKLNILNSREKTF